MSSFCLPTWFSAIISFFLLLTTAYCTDPLDYNCTTSTTTFSPYDSFDSALFSVFTHIYKKASTTRYAAASSTAGGGATPAATAYGLAYCRGDASTNDCASCLANATVELRALCPGIKSAVIWYDNCVLKYSDQDFFGKVDFVNKFALVNVNTLTTSTKFVNTTTTFLGNLSNSAVHSPTLYSAGEDKLFEFLTLYGYAQCSGDLSPAECRRCLGLAVDRIPDCCAGQQGGRVVSSSCTVRYEIYPTVNSQKSS